MKQKLADAAVAGATFVYGLPGAVGDLAANAAGFSAAGPVAGTQCHSDNMNKRAIYVDANGTCRTELPKVRLANQRRSMLTFRATQCLPS
jgi:hypothetical protein